MSCRYSHKIEMNFLMNFLDNYLCFDKNIPYSVFNSFGVKNYNYTFRFLFLNFKFGIYLPFEVLDNVHQPNHDFPID